MVEASSIATIMGVIKNEYDVEGYSPTETEKQISSRLPVYQDETGAVPGESFTVGNSLYAKIQRFAGKYAIEQRGIERVPEDERTDTNLAKVGTMVCSRSEGIADEMASEAHKRK